MSWQNRTFKYATDEVSYPYVQWVNDPTLLEPYPGSGGFAAPVSQGLAIRGTLHRLHHKNGDITEVIFTPRLRVAVIATRFAWVDEDRRILPDYQDGARGKVQALCYIDVGDEPPVLGMLTFTGMVSKAFRKAKRSFTDEIKRATKSGAPSWAFWMSLKAGKPETVGSKKRSTITPIELACAPDPDNDYIGDELADTIEALLDTGEVQSWKAAWPNGGNGNGNGKGHGNGNGYDDDTTRYLTDEQIGEWPMPKNSKGYVTVGQAIDAGDRASLEALLRWADGKEDHRLLAGVVRQALEMIDDMISAGVEDDEDEIPF